MPRRLAAHATTAFTKDENERYHMRDCPEIPASVLRRTLLLDNLSRIGAYQWSMFAKMSNDRVTDLLGVPKCRLADLSEGRWQGRRRRSHLPSPPLCYAELRSEECFDAAPRHSHLLWIPLHVCLKHEIAKLA